MNRNVVSVALVFVVFLMVLGLAGCQAAAPTNRNEIATTSPAKETYDEAAIQAEVMKTERDWFTAGQTYDVEAIKRIVADDAVLVYPDGTLGNKAEEVRLAETKAITTDGWEILESKVTVLSADAAYITGRSRIKNGKYKAPNQPRPIDISGDYRFLDVYSKRNGTWQVIASQATTVAVPTASPTASPAASPAGYPSPAATRTASPTK